MMDKGQFDRELRYGAVMAAARAMFKSGIVDENDYRKIDIIMRRKYRPIIGGLQAANIPDKL